MSDDPERLLAEALRAQARYAPPAPPTAPTAPTAHTAHTAPTTPAAQPVQPTPSARPAMPTGRPAPLADPPGGSAGYGLLAGTPDDDPRTRRPAVEARDADARPATAARGSHRLEPEPLPARWVLILAASIGLAVGSVVGLLTLL